MRIDKKPDKYIMIQRLLLTTITLVLASCSSHAKKVFDGRNLSSLNSEFSCKSTKSPVFNSKNTHKAFEITLIANQEELQKNSETTEYGELKKDENLISLIQLEHKGVLHTIPSLVRQRGNSRRESCDFKPLKISFLGEQLAGKAKPNGENTESKDFYKTYYNNLKGLYAARATAGSENDFVATKQTATPFKGLGKTMKIVSHCGNSSWPALSLPNKKAQEQALLQEYYLYKIRELLYPQSLNTQLIKINYSNPNGESIETALGFFRERVERTAKRCGLNKLEGDIEDFKTNKASAYEGLFTMLLLHNFDFGYSAPKSEVSMINEVNESGHTESYENYFEAHNVAIATSDQKEIHIIPYDFDLSILIRGNSQYIPATSDSEELKQELESWWDEISTIEKRIKILQRWILGDFPDADQVWVLERDSSPEVTLQRGKKSIKNFLNKANKIEKLIKGSLLTNKNKEKFLKWLEKSKIALTETLKTIEDQ